MVNTKYMYSNNWTLQYRTEISNNYNTDKDPYCKEITDGILLPSLANDKKKWGLGGCVKDGRFVKESGCSVVFGGGYSIDETNIPYLNMNILFIGILPNHWGHFLIDTLCRMYPIVEGQVYDKIAFCGWGWKTNKLSSNYIQAFKLLGISEEKLLYIDKPMKINHVTIPKPSFGFGISYSYKYKKVIECMISNALNSSECMSLKPIDDIYFTRTNLKKAKMTEFGERLLEKRFQDNGYTVLSPEKKSLYEQIYYINNCKHMASLSGTIPHNAVFAGKCTQVVILNRACVINPPQIRINQLFELDVMMVDCYAKWIEKHPRDYGEVPLLVFESNELKQFCRDQHFIMAPLSVKDRIVYKVIPIIHFFALEIIRELGFIENAKEIYHKIKKDKLRRG